VKYNYVWLIVMDTSIGNYEPVTVHIIGDVLQHNVGHIYNMTLVVPLTVHIS